MSELFLTQISDPSLDMHALSAIFASKGAQFEAVFWQALVDESAHRPEVRRLAVEQLFTQHVPAGTDLSDAASVARAATWTNAAEVSRVNGPTAKIPMSLDAEESLFILPVLPTLAGKGLTLYLRLSDHIDLRPFNSVFFGDTSSSAEPESAQIRQHVFWRS